MNETKGKGVDCVLNSLDGELLEVSLEVVAEYGHFCEIGKYDLLNNTKIGIKVFEKNISYHAIDLAEMFTNPVYSLKLSTIFNNLLINDMVVPLPYKIFEANETSDALRYMGSGKHRGKVLIHMEEFETSNVKRTFTTSGTHILIGGLGGFGLELASWLLKNGASNVVLTSRNGIKNNRQKWKLSKLNNIMLETNDVIQFNDCLKLIDKYRVNLKGVWNLATVLEDTMFTNMTDIKWDNLYNIKAIATHNLDKCTQGMSLDAFVFFSSISSMIGNIGQTNYASANNAGEMIIRERNKRGDNGIAIQWGAIDNVGLMMNLNKDGLTSGVCEFQNIDHSIKSLHYLLGFNGVYSSYAEKKLKTDEINVDVSAAQYIAKILGGNAVDYDVNAPIMNFGLDSLSSIELVNWINRQVSVKITPAFITSTTTIQTIEEYLSK